jgi:hypothetical protein
LLYCLLLGMLLPLPLLLVLLLSQNHLRYCHMAYCF